MIRVNVEIIDERRANILRMSLDEYRDFIDMQAEVLGIKAEEYLLKPKETLEKIEILKEIQELKRIIKASIGFLDCMICNINDEENITLGGEDDDK